MTEVQERSGTGRATTVLGFVLLLVLAGGVVWLIYRGIKDAPSVMGALVTAGGAIGAVVAGRVWETRKQVELERRERMAPTYDGLLDQLFSAIRSEDGEVRDDLLTFFDELHRKLLLWGPQPIIKAFIAWRAETGAQPEGSAESMLAFERLIVAMRKDLGVKSDDLSAGDLLRVFLTDFDEHFKSFESKG